MFFGHRRTGRIWVLVCLFLLGAGPAALLRLHAKNDSQDETGREPATKMANISNEQLKALLEGVEGSDTMKRLLRKRVDVALTEADARYAEFFVGRGTLSLAIEASTRLMEAQRGLSRRLADQLPPLEAHAKRMEMIVTVNRARHEAGRIQSQDLALSEHASIEAQLWVERAKVGMAPRPQS